MEYCYGYGLSDCFFSVLLFAFVERILRCLRVRCCCCLFCFLLKLIGVVGSSCRGGGRVCEPLHLLLHVFFGGGVGNERCFGGVARVLLIDSLILLLLRLFVCVFSLLRSVRTSWGTTCSRKRCGNSKA